jgi:SOS response regulatory protein OraA/RecX
VPADVVVRAGISEGQVLNRPDLRRFRRELRRAEALAAAERALRVRDLSEQELAARLERARISPPAAAAALEALGRAGLVDDGRVARHRAQALADRGYGDAAIRHDLEGRNLGQEAVQAALDALEPETDRAAHLIERRGTGLRTARYLAARGFAEEVVAAGAGPVFANDP